MKRSFCLLGNLPLRRGRAPARPVYSIYVHAVYMGRGGLVYNIYVHAVYIGTGRAGARPLRITAR